MTRGGGTSAGVPAAEGAGCVAPKSSSMAESGARVWKSGRGRRRPAGPSAQDALARLRALLRDGTLSALSASAPPPSDDAEDAPGPLAPLPRPPSSPLAGPLRAYLAHGSVWWPCAGAGRSGGGWRGEALWALEKAALGHRVALGRAPGDPVVGAGDDGDEGLQAEGERCARGALGRGRGIRSDPACGGSERPRP